MNKWWQMAWGYLEVAVRHMWGSVPRRKLNLVSWYAGNLSGSSWEWDMIISGPHHKRLQWFWQWTEAKWFGSTPNKHRPKDTKPPTNPTATIVLYPVTCLEPFRLPSLVSWIASIEETLRATIFLELHLPLHIKFFPSWEHQGHLVEELAPQCNHVTTGLALHGRPLESACLTFWPRLCVYRSTGILTTWPFLINLLLSPLPDHWFLPISALLTFFFHLLLHSFIQQIFFFSTMYQALWI